MSSAAITSTTDSTRRTLLGAAIAAGWSAALSACGGANSADAVGTVAEASTAGLAPTRPTASVGQPRAIAQTVGNGFALPAIGDIQFQTINFAELVVLEAWHFWGPYEHFQRLVILQGSKNELVFKGMSLANGGGDRPFGSARYTLLLNGVVVAETTVTPGSQKAKFVVDVAGMSPGWRQMDIGGLAPTESSPTWFVYVQGPGEVSTDFIPVSRSTHALTTGGDQRNAWVLAPSQYQPTILPLARRRAYAAPDASLARAGLHCEHLVPLRLGDIHRPNVTKDDVVSTFDSQGYYWSTLTGPLPKLASLDGPRGIGTVAMATHLALSTAAPDGTPRNNVYFSDAWRIGKISEDGTVTTLVGYRHRSMPSHWEDPAVPELIGDWSAIPAARRGFHEIWGFAWDERTLPINEAAPRIPSENNEHPHFVGPAMFVTDAQNNRVIRVEFSATQHGVPPKVTEFLTGLADPWDIVYRNGLIYVSERQAHRIAVYDVTTGARIKILVQGSALAYVDQNRDTVRTADLATIQAQPCVAPEGLYLMDNWLYFASKAQDQVRRVDLDTGAIEVVRPVTLDASSKFAKVVVSDGTFGPKGTTFTWTWTVSTFGFPAMYTPAGARMANWGGSNGGTGHWLDLLGYSSAGAVGQGRMVTAGMIEGVLRISKMEAGDAADSAAVSRGRQDYFNRGLNLLWGHAGFGFFGVDLPWGVSDDIDAYLQSYGHTKVQAAPPRMRYPLRPSAVI